jgi:hypothetical protein
MQFVVGFSRKILRPFSDALHQRIMSCSACDGSLQSCCEAGTELETADKAEDRANASEACSLLYCTANGANADPPIL